MDCLFCSIVNTPDLHTNPEDRILEESSNFYAKPALGHFIEGYTLIISKNHNKTFSSLCKKELEELNIFKNKIATKLKRIYKTSIIAFEHGCVNSQKRSGSCIDHAHMHLIPFDIDIDHLLTGKFSYEVITDLSILLEYQIKDLSYLYYQSCSDKEFIFRIDSHLPSQFLRKAVCNTMQDPDIWDWAIYPFRESISSFINTYVSHTS